MNAVKRPTRMMKSIAAHQVACILDTCTGCGGQPVCRIFCKRKALWLADDPENYPFKKMRVDPEQCTGCGSCVQNGPQGIHLSGCPWDAIRLIPKKPAMTPHYYGHPY